VIVGAFQQHRWQLNLCECPQWASLSVCAGNLPPSISDFATEASLQFGNSKQLYGGRRRASAEIILRF
jgi:hypothetical protein